MSQTAIKNHPIPSVTTERNAHSPQAERLETSSSVLNELTVPKTVEVAPLTQDQFLKKHARTEIGQTTMYVTVA